MIFNSQIYPVNKNILPIIVKVPEGLISEKGVPVNRGNIYPTITSPPSVHKAYLDQFEKDFTKFLSLRSEELITEGRMILTLRGNQSKDESFNNYRPIFLELIGSALHEMVLEVPFFYSCMYICNKRHV